MTLKFGVFDDSDPAPEQRINQIYLERLTEIECLDAAEPFAYHLAEDHRPAHPYPGAVAERLLGRRGSARDSPTLQSFRTRLNEAPRPC